MATTKTETKTTHHDNGGAVSVTPTTAAAPATKKVRQYKPTDDFRVLGRISRELETLPKAAQTRVLEWLKAAHADGTLRHAVEPTPRADQPLLPMTGVPGYNPNAHGEIKADHNILNTLNTTSTRP